MTFVGPFQLGIFCGFMNHFRHSLSVEITNSKKDKLKKDTPHLSTGYGRKEKGP